MKQLADDYADHLASGVTTLVYCVRIERTDGKVHRFTDHDEPLEMSNGSIYEPDVGGADASAIRTSADLEPDTIDLEGMLSPHGITREELGSGAFSDAAVFVFRCRWDKPVEDEEPLAAGFLGTVELDGDRYTATMTSLADELEQSIGRQHLPTCDALLGDSRCKVDVSQWTELSTISTLHSQLEFDDGGLGKPDDWAGGGVVEILSGDNIGFSREVATHDNGRIKLRRAFPYPLQGGEDIGVTAGCRKRFNEDCIGKFGNAINHRGFPHLPGMDAAMQVGTG